MRYVALFFWLLVSCSHSATSPNPALTPAPPIPDPALYDQIVVVGTNDFHGYLKPVESVMEGEKVIVGGAEWFAGYVRILEKKFGDRLVLLDGGDIFQGTLESNSFLGKPVVDFYNLLPYRAAAVGNHEFDYGPRKKGDPDRLGAFRDRLNQAKFPFVQANTFWKKSGKLWREKNLFPSVIVNAGAYKIGVIGLTTTSTPAKTLPLNVKELEFRDFREPALREARALRKQGVDFVMLATHEGGEKPGEPLYELLKALPAGTVDAVVSGHAHSQIQQFIHHVPVIQSKTRGLNFGRIDLFVEKATRKIVPSLTYIHSMHWVCGTWFKNYEGCDQRAAKDLIAANLAKPSDMFPLQKVFYEGEEVQPDLKVRAVLAPYFAQTDSIKKEVLGEALKDFDWYPSGESQMGFLFIDGFRDAFPYAKVVLHNGGGIRRRIFQGPITYGDLYEVHPFENYAVALEMTGKQLKDLVRLGVSGANTVPAVWGVRASYFTDSNPKYQRDINGDGKKETWENDRLASLVWEKTGKPVGDSEKFWLATNDYLASGGDNTNHIFGSIPPTRRRYLDLNQRDVVAEYLRKHPKLELPKVDEMRLRKAQ